MAQSRVVVLNEATKGSADEWRLCFQWCRYEFADGTEENGYRFIWRRPSNALQGARGQARIPSLADILELTAEAVRQGWGHHSATYGGIGVEGEEE